MLALVAVYNGNFLVTARSLGLVSVCLLLRSGGARTIGLIGGESFNTGVQVWGDRNSLNCVRASGKSAGLRTTTVEHRACFCSHKNFGSIENCLVLYWIGRD